MRGVVHGIGFRLAILLASFGIVAMSLVGYTSYASSRAALLNATQRDLLTATQVLGKSFQDRIGEVSAHALLLARLTPSLQVGGSMSGSDKDRLAEAFTAMLEVHADYFQARLISAAAYGIELVRVDRDVTLLLRIDGLHLQEKAHYPYVFNTLKLKRGEVYLSDITLNRESGAHAGLDKPTLRVATPVAGADGVIVGLIVINIDLETMFAHLKKDLPGNYQLYLSNHWGDYLIHPDPTLAFAFDHGRRELVQQHFAPVQDLIDGRQQNVVTSSEAEAEGGRVAAFARLPMGQGKDAHFVVLGLTQPLDSVMHEARELGWDTVRIILVLGAVAVLLAALVSRAVTGPLRQMAHAVKRFSNERVVSELPSESQDQIGLLARSLNEMQRTIVANIRELDDSRQALRHLAQHDGLTGLPNRALFEDRLRQAMAQARRSEARIALLFVDLDGFKAVNDSCGHHTGDLLLTAVAQRIAGCVRDSDTAGRIGGDEFVILLSAIELERDALAVAEKVRASLAMPFNLDGPIQQISASIGVALYPQHGDSEHTLALSADAAMYQAKARGGNRVQLSGVA